MKTLLETVADWSDRIQNGRTDLDVLRSIQNETDELRDEILIANGTLDWAKPGPDGKFGEAIDIICSAIDMLRRERPNLTLWELEEEAAAYADRKCRKWAAKYGTIPDDSRD